MLAPSSHLSIRAVRFAGATSEFSRLPGLLFPVSHILKKMEKVVIHSKRAQNSVRVPFAFSGPGEFSRGDIALPAGISCVNPALALNTVAGGSSLHGHLLISNFACPSQDPGWIAIRAAADVKSVGFRIESLGPFNSAVKEILVLEILTNGAVPPQKAFYNSVNRLTYQFASLSLTSSRLNHEKRIFCKNCWPSKKSDQKH